jgi:hypothetical protein
MSKVEKFWENATADDFARVMEGETVEARFWDDNLQGWATRTLSGWQATGVRPLWHSSDGFVWTRCQVYREPSWYTNKPDPGPGFRLLGKFPDEAVRGGDFIRGFDGNWTELRNGCNPKQAEDLWYRRRIEPVEPKFAVGQTVKVVGPKATDARHWDSEMARHAGTLQTIKYIEGFANPPEIFYGVHGIDSRKFREDYLEPVEPEPVEAPNTYHYTNPGDVVHCPNGTVIVIGSKGFEVTQ